MDKRHFTVVIGSKEHGLYVSSTPSSAAKKAVSKLCSSNKSKKVEFYLREITQGSKKKTYGPYLGEMKKLKTPIELKGRVIRYEIIVHLKKKSIIKTVKKMRGGKRVVSSNLNLYDFICTFTDKYKPKKLGNLSLEGRGNNNRNNVNKLLEEDKIKFLSIAYDENDNNNFFMFFCPELYVTKNDQGFKFFYKYVAYMKKNSFFSDERILQFKKREEDRIKEVDKKQIPEQDIKKLFKKLADMWIDRTVSGDDKLVYQEILKFL
jgi:hypothetical protein